jgi:hypothetical protein
VVASPSCRIARSCRRKRGRADDSATCDTLSIMGFTSSVVLLALGASCVTMTACTSGSSGGSNGESTTRLTGTYGAESGGATGSAQVGDCGINPLFDVDAHNIAPRATQYGVGPQATPVDALHAVLTHGSAPFFGGTGGSGVVAMGYPAAGWTEISASSGTAAFRAPLHSGTAQLIFSRVGNRWLLSHGEKDC